MRFQSAASLACLAFSLQAFSLPVHQVSTHIASRGLESGAASRVAARYTAEDDLWHREFLIRELAKHYSSLERRADEGSASRPGTPESKSSQASQDRRVAPHIPAEQVDHHPGRPGTPSDRSDFSGHGDVSSEDEVTTPLMPGGSHKKISSHVEGATKAAKALKALKSSAGSAGSANTKRPNDADYPLRSANNNGGFHEVVKNPSGQIFYLPAQPASGSSKKA